MCLMSNAVQKIEFKPEKQYCTVYDIRIMFLLLKNCEIIPSIIVEA